MKNKKRIIILITIAAIIIAVIVMTIIPMLHKVRGTSPDALPKKTVEESIERELEYMCPTDCSPGKKYNEDGVCPLCNLPLTLFKTKDVNDNSTNKLEFLKKEAEPEQSTENN